MENDNSYQIADLLGGYEAWPMEYVKSYFSDHNITLASVTTNTGITLLLFEHGGVRYVGESEEDAVSVKKVTDFLEDILTFDRVYKYVELPSFNDEFWSCPGVLYHGTSERAWEEIQQSGVLEARAETRGLGNRGMPDAVFTSLAPQAAAEYGGVVLRIDTRAMKADGLTPTTAMESPLEEREAIMAVANLVGADDYDVDVEAGLDYDTVAIYDNIFLKYISKTEEEKC